MRHQRKILLIDADDTLWETNALFERTIAAYVELLAPLNYDPQTIRQEVDRAEHQNIQQRGYGTRSFLLTLEEVYLKLARRGGQARLGGQVGQRAEEKVLEEIRRLSRILLPVPHRVFDGVAATLTYLKPRHRLFLLTKGNAEEQSAKLAASGLEGFFHVVQLIGQRFHAQHQIAQAFGLALLGRVGVGDVDRAAGRGDFHPHLSRKARRQPGQNETEKQSHAQGLPHVFPLL